MTDKLSPVHPGEVLLEEFIKPMGLSRNRLSIDIGVDGRRINEIVLGKRAITADTALRFHTSLAIHLNSGGGCSRNMILILLRIILGNGWNVKYVPAPWLNKNRERSNEVALCF